MGSRIIVRPAALKRLIENLSLRSQQRSLHLGFGVVVVLVLLRRSNNILSNILTCAMREGTLIDQATSGPSTSIVRHLVAHYIPQLLSVLLPVPEEYRAHGAA